MQLHLLGATETVTADGLRQRIERELGWNCSVPYYLETVELD
jgi:metallo-beta-lactamase family protein